jgi:hypothetical protein
MLYGQSKFQNTGYYVYCATDNHKRLLTFVLYNNLVRHCSQAESTNIAQIDDGQAESTDIAESDDDRRLAESLTAPQLKDQFESRD